MADITKVKYLIIGNSAGGIGAAEAIRRADKKGTITIVSDEPYPVYSRPLISEHLAEGYPLEKMLYRPEEFYEENVIHTVLGKKAVKVDTDKKRVVLDDDTAISWDKLLLATGGIPIVPQMEGTDKKGVFTFTTLDDAKMIRDFLNRQSAGRQRAVVIGGGLIGVSVTEALVKRGVQVTIVEMKDRVLNTILDIETSEMMASVMKQAGVEIITDNTVRTIYDYTPDEVAGVILADGKTIPCELVVVAIGVRPRIELASGTEIEVDRGIIVNRQMMTSVPDVYACGDVSQAYDFVYEENRLSPIWPNAYNGGRIAGSNMAGVREEYSGGTAMNAMKYFGVSIVSAGMSAEADEESEIITDRQGDHYRKVVLKDGRIIGMVFSGDIEKAGIIYSLMKDGTNASSFKKALVAEDFGITSLPEELWRPKLEIPDGLAEFSISHVEEPDKVPAAE